MTSGHPGSFELCSTPKVWVFVRTVLVFIFVLVVASQWCLGVYFAAKAPTMPDPSQGVIYPVRIHQSVVYLTREQSSWYNDRVLDVADYSAVTLVLGELLAQWWR